MADDAPDAPHPTWRPPPAKLPFSPNTLLAIATLLMLAQQAMVYLGTSSVPVAAPEIARELGLDVALVGIYVATSNLTGTIFSTLGGGIIPRLGPVRVSQICLLITGAGVTLVTTGLPPLMLVGAIAAGIGAAPSVPASSQILARYAPPKVAPLIFSIKQTGVPVGGMIAGILIPFLIIAYSWHAALYAVAALSIFFAGIMQFFRAEFDSDRVAGAGTRLPDLWRNVREVFQHPALRILGFTAMAFIGIQMAFATFFVAYLVKGLGHDIETAGLVFSIGQMSAIGFRIIWGWISDRYLPASRVLSMLGFGTAVSAGIVASLTPELPVWVLGLVCVIFTSTAYSWNGVLWAEVARNAPPGRVGALTGPVVSFAFAGSTIFPALSAALLAATDSFAPVFVVSAAPALVMAIVLAFKPWRRDGR